MPKISSSSRRSRRVLRAPQTAEQLVDVPTVVSFSSLQQQRAEQIIDTPVLHRHRGGGGGLQGFLPEQNTLTFQFRMVFNVYAQVRFLLLHPLTHLVLRMRLLQGFSNFSQNKKKCEDLPHPGVRTGCGLHSLEASSSLAPAHLPRVDLGRGGTRRGLCGATIF